MFEQGIGYGDTKFTCQVVVTGAGEAQAVVWMLSALGGSRWLWELRGLLCVCQCPLGLHGILCANRCLLNLRDTLGGVGGS